MRGWSGYISTADTRAAGGSGYLSEAQADRVASALPSFVGTWSLHRHESCDGNLMLLVTHDCDDLASFAVDAVGGRISMSVLRDDVMRPCGRFDTIEELIIALRDCAERETSGICH